MTLITPKPLAKGSRLAVTAFSSGIKEAYRPRLDVVIKQFQQRGIDVVLGSCLVQGVAPASASAQERADELMRFLLDDQIDAIAPPWGGELAIDVLPLLDFKALSQARPKWVFGFSDVSTVAVALTTKLNWATLHSSNLMDLVPSPDQPLVEQTFEFLMSPASNWPVQLSTKHHTRQWPDFVANPEVPLGGDTKTQWRWLNAPAKGNSIRGRLVGGCWDTLQHLFATEYCDLSELKNRWDDDLILYLENCEMSPYDIARTLHAMKFRGVFNRISALVLGRSSFQESTGAELTYQQAVEQYCGELDFPVLVDVDIGHVPPNMSLVNGAIGEFKLDSDGQGELRQYIS